MALVTLAWFPGIRDASSQPAETIVLTATRDADVRSPKPTKSYGAYPDLVVDSSPASRTFLEFDASSLAGREVVGARLELAVTDRSDAGGDVVAVSEPWSESVTWNTQPATTGPVLASIGKVVTGTTTSTPLPPEVVTGGRTSLAILPTSSDGARYSSREGAQAPRLVVTLAPAPTTTTAPTTTSSPTTTSPTTTVAPSPAADDGVADGTAQIASPTSGSSDPTLYAMNSRLAATGAGRMLAVHGKHGDGVQLAWRDRGSTAWSSRTGGAVPDGRLLSGTGTGDWTASMVVDRVGGEEHAWVLIAHHGYRSTPAPVWMRRLSALDGPDGPTVGPAVVLTPADVFAKQADVRAARAADGALRLAVAWTERVDGINRVRAGWLDPALEQPTLVGVTDLTSASSNQLHGSFVETDPSAPLILVVKGSSGKIRLHRHTSLEVGTPWTAGAASADVGTAKNAPHGVVQPDGSILVAVQPDPSVASVRTIRFNADGSTAVTAPGLADRAAPALAIVGTETWVVSVRGTDRAVMASRQSATGWTEERVLLSGEATAGLADAPNVEKRGRDGRLRLIVRGSSGAAGKHSVLYVQQPNG